MTKQLDEVHNQVNNLKHQKHTCEERARLIQDELQRVKINLSEKERMIWAVEQKNKEL